MARRRTLSPVPHYLLSTLLLGLLFSAGCISDRGSQLVAPTPRAPTPADANSASPTATDPAAETASAANPDAEVARIARLSQGKAYPLTGEAFREQVGRDPEQYPGHYFEIRSAAAATGQTRLATLRVARNGTYVYLPSGEGLLEGRSELIESSTAGGETGPVFARNGERYRLVDGEWHLLRSTREMTVDVEGQAVRLRIVNDSRLQGVEQQLTAAEGHDLFVWSLKALAAASGSEWQTLFQESLAGGRVEVLTPALNIVENCLHKDRDFAYPESRYLDFSRGLELTILDGELAAQNRVVQSAGVWPWVNTARLPYGTAWSRTRDDVPRLILVADSAEALDKALLSGWWIVAHLPDVGAGESSMAGNAHRGLFHFGAEAVGDGLFERPLWDWAAAPPAGPAFFADA